MDEQEQLAVESGDTDELVALGYTAAVAAFLVALSPTNRRRAASLLKKDKRLALNRLGDLVGYQAAGSWPSDPVAIRALSALWFRDMDLPRRVRSAVGAGAARSLSPVSAPTPSRQVSVGVMTSKPLSAHYARLRNAQVVAERDLRKNLTRNLATMAAKEIAWKPLTNMLYRYSGAPPEEVRTVVNFVKGRVEGVVLESLGLAAETGAKQILTELPETERLIDVFDNLSPWAINHAKQMGESFGEDVNKTFMAEASRAVVQNLNATELEKNLQRTFGLTPRQAGWVNNRIEAVDSTIKNRLLASYAETFTLGDRVLGRLLPPPEQAATQLANKLLASRIKTLSNTETMIAFNYGRQILLTSARDRGVLPADVDKVWVTAIDERVCPICGPMDGRRARFDEQFVTKNDRVLVPPVHPNCRCTIIPSNLFEQGIITRTARAAGRNLSSEDDYALAKHMGPGLHPSGSPQAVHSRFDMNRVTGAKHGDVVVLSASFMDQFRLGMGMRAENEKYVRNLARHILQTGFPGPVVLSIYEDGNMRVGDGHHRMEAAALLGLDRLPVRILHLPGDRPGSPGLKPPDHRMEERIKQRNKLQSTGDDFENIHPISEALNRLKREQDMRFRVHEELRAYDEKNENIPIPLTHLTDKKRPWWKPWERKKHG